MSVTRSVKSAKKPASLSRAKVKAAVKKVTAAKKTAVAKKAVVAKKPAAK